MYYRINEDDREFESAEDVVDYLVTSEYYTDDEEGFNEYLDEEGYITVAGYDFLPSDILYNENRDAYMHELEEWAEAQAETARENFTYELERLNNGESTWVNGYTVTAYEDSETEGDTDVDEELISIAELEIQLQQRREEEARQHKEQEKSANDFLSALGIQVI